MIRSPFLRWGLGAIVAVAVLGVLRYRMFEPAEDDAHVATSSSRREVLTVGFLPVIGLMLFAEAVFERLRR